MCGSWLQFPAGTVEKAPHQRPHRGSPRSSREAVTAFLNDSRNTSCVRKRWEVDVHLGNSLQETSASQRWCTRSTDCSQQRSNYRPTV